MKYFSKESGFTSLPKNGSVELSEEFYAYLMNNQGQDGSIEVDEYGYPFLKLDDKTEGKSNDVRTKRDVLLNKSDWTQLADIPDRIKIPYQDYRQKLRDIPHQKGFPFDVEWPETPST